MPDGSGQSEDSLRDAGAHSLGCAPAMAFEIELGLEGLVDRLDDLAQRTEEGGSGPFGFSFTSGPEQAESLLAQLGLEVTRVVVLIGDQGLAGLGGAEVGCGGEQVDQGLAFVGFRAGQRPGDRESLQGADQVETQAPEESGVGGAVAVLGPSGQVGAL